MAIARALRTFIENALFIITNVSSIYITYTTFSSLSNYICHADPSTTASDVFGNPDLQTLWSEREDVLKWCSVACYIVYVCESGTEIEEQNSICRKAFPIIAWGVHFETAMYVGGYLAGLCVLRLMYDLLMRLRMIMGFVGICGIVMFLARQSELEGREEKRFASSKLSPEIRPDEAPFEDIDGDSKIWNSDGILTPPSTPDLEGYV